MRKFGYVILCAAVIGAVNFVWAKGSSVPDVISRSGVIIDFTEGKPSWSIPSGMPIQDVVEVASELMEKYVQPHIEEGTVSKRDFYLLMFCIEAADVQAGKLRLWAEAEMGIAGKDIEQGIEDIELGGERYSPRGVRESLLSGCENSFDASRFESYCRAYNYKGKDNAFVDSDGIWKAINKGRDLEGKDSQEVLRSLDLDPDIYKACKQIEEMRPGFWGHVFNWNHWYWKERRWAWDSVEGTEMDVRDFVGRLEERTDYFDLIDSPKGFYQRTYMNLVRMGHLIECWRNSGWKSSFEMTDDDKRKVEKWREEVLKRSRDTLVYMEDTFVNYPLMCNLIEATSVNLHMNVLEAKEQEYKIYKEEKEMKAEKVRALRKYWLENSSKVGNLCSKYCRYSMSFMTRNEAEKYNILFMEAYATNRLALFWGDKEKTEEFLKYLSLGVGGLSGEIALGMLERNLELQKNVTVPEEIKEQLRKYDPMFDENEKSYVDAGLVRLSNDVGYNQVIDACCKLCEKRLLQEFCVYYFGDGLVGNWMNEVCLQFPQRWMYPSWSEEARQWGVPLNSEKIVGAVETCLSSERVVKKMELVLCAMLRIHSELKVMKEMFKKHCGGEENLQDAKEEMVDFIEEKSLPEEVEKKIEQSFGSIEKFVDAWFACLNVNFDDQEIDYELGVEKRSLDGIAGQLEREYLPFVKAIEEANRKWYKWIWPF